MVLDMHCNILNGGPFSGCKTAPYTSIEVEVEGDVKQHHT